jgi:putative endonuclease
MMASRRHGTLYIGVTGDLARRAFEHREGLLPGFTRKYGCKRLVWYEVYESIDAAIQRGKIAEEMASGLEDQPDRARESVLG